MDWDGVGTFALFLSSGAVGVGLILLRAYRLRLQHKIEVARLGSQTDLSEDVMEHLQSLEDRMGRLDERVEFTERLLTEGPKATDSVSGRHPG